MLLRKTPVALALAAIFSSTAVAGPADTPPEPASADARPLGEITISATRTARSTEAVPNTVTVHDRQRLRQRDARDLKDLLEQDVDIAVRASTPRFTAAGASSGRAGNEGINIRGLEGNQVLMSLDGIRLPQSFSFGAFASGRVDYLDTELLAGAEVLRGPASTQFGSDGLGGALLLRTLSAEDLLTGGRRQSGFVSAGAASVDRSTKLSAGGAAAFGPWTVLLAGVTRQGHGLRTQGDDESPNAKRTAVNPTDVEGWPGFKKFSPKIDLSR